MVNAIGSAVLIFAVWTFNIVFGLICDIGTANLACGGKCELYTEIGFTARPLGCRVTF